MYSILNKRAFTNSGLQSTNLVLKAWIRKELLMDKEIYSQKKKNTETNAVEKKPSVLITETTRQ